jgi:hypothetical protein
MSGALAPGNRYIWRAVRDSTHLSVFRIFSNESTFVAGGSECSVSCAEEARITIERAEIAFTGSERLDDAVLGRSGECRQYGGLQ